MTWSKSKPAGTDKIRLSDEMIRENWDCIEDALNRAHKFPGTKGDDAGIHDLALFEDQGSDPSNPASGRHTIFTKSDGLYLRDPSGTQRKVDGEIPSGTNMIFYESAAPTGWTFKTYSNDRVLLTTSTEAEGGDAGGDWTPSGMNSAGAHTHTLNSHKHETPTLSDSARPHQVEASAWPHGLTGTTRNGKRADSPGDNTTSYQTMWSGEPSTANTGSNGAHTHTFNGSWRPKYSKVIICQKD